MTFALRSRFPRRAPRAIATLAAVAALAGCRPSGTAAGAPAPVGDSTGTPGLAGIAGGGAGADRPVEGQALGKRHVASFRDLLEALPGVRVTGDGASMTVRVRGSGSLANGGEPLYILDGVPLSGSVTESLLAINPDDVERIDVLRDAGSLAFYGSRGANGVIVIRRKTR